MGDRDDGTAGQQAVAASHAAAATAVVPNPAGELAATFEEDPAAAAAAAAAGGGLDPDHRDAEPDEEELLEAKRGDDSNCLSNTCVGRLFFNSRWLLAFLCTYVVLQSMSVTGLFGSVLSTIERRYGMSSTTAGGLSSVYDTVVLSTTWVAGYYGGRGRALRWLASGMLVVGLGSLLFAAPHAIGGEYNYPGLSTRAFCLAAPPGGELPELAGDCSGSDALVVATFFVAMIVVGLGASPLYTLGPAYLDRVVKARHLPVYLGIFYATGALGPALGFVLSGVFLNTWVDGSDNEPDDVKPGDPEWVGAWWNAYLVVGVLAVLLSAPLFMFPKWVPRTRHVRRRLRRQAREAAAAAALAGKAVDTTLRGTLAALAANRTFVFNCLGQASESFMVAGFASFLPKAAESVFRLTPSEAAFSIGAVLVPGAAGGIFFGGWLMKRLRASTSTVVKSTFVIAACSFLFMASFYIGCGSLDLAGVTEPYPAPGGGFGANATCNAACECDPDGYRPVCGSDGMTYFSACFAGCASEDVADEEWSQCACVGAEGGGAALAGKCDDGCSALAPFLVMLFLAMFSTFANNVPSTQVVLGATQVQHRPVGLAVQSVTYRLLGFIPGPLIFGAAFDQACRMAETKCLGEEETGACWEYDTLELRRSMLLLAMLPKACSMLFFGTSLYFYRRDLRDTIEAAEHAGVPPSSSAASVKDDASVFAAIEESQNRVAVAPAPSDDEPAAGAPTRRLTADDRGGVASDEE